MTKINEQHKAYGQIALAIEYITRNALKQPTLSQVAMAVGMSEFHLQRLFTQWAGLSPKRFLQFLSKERALAALKNNENILNTSLDSGLSSPSRLHDLMITCEAMTPGEIKLKGQGVLIEYANVETPFGEALLAWTTRGICHLTFLDDNREQAKQALFALWQNAQLEHNSIAAQALASRIFSKDLPAQKFHLLLRGTNFQIKVWQALLSVGNEQLVSYGGLARLAGSEKAQRAVGSALAVNNIGFLIPCHRVIKANAEQGNYRWGQARKLAIQTWEAAETVKEAHD